MDHRRINQNPTGRVWFRVYLIEHETTADSLRRLKADLRREGHMVVDSDGADLEVGIVGEEQRSSQELSALMHAAGIAGYFWPGWRPSDN